MKILKRFLKSIIRATVYARLHWLPLNEESALRWAFVMKRWPAIFGASPFCDVKIVNNGARMRLGLLDVIERQLFVTGVWEEEIAQLMARELRVGMTVVDVGANIGYFALLAGKLVGAQGCVIALEPSHRNLSRLTENLWLNRVKNAVVLSIAAGAAAGFPRIAFPTYNNAGAATLRNVPSVQEQRAAQLKLDDVFALLERHPEFVKIDVEGYELEVLKGMERTLKAYHPVVVCELTDAFLREMGQSARELLAFMEQCGYWCELISTPQGRECRQINSNDLNLPTSQVDVVFRMRASDSCVIGKRPGRAMDRPTSDVPAPTDL